MSLYAWDEIYYFSDTGGWTRNRFALGGRKALNATVAISLYYQHQLDSHSKPARIDTIGLTTELRLR
jgi:hypothetical protein